MADPFKNIKETD